MMFHTVLQACLLILAAAAPSVTLTPHKQTHNVQKTRIDLSNGYTINFGGTGMDALGRKGQQGRVDNKFKERFGITRIHEFYGASEGNSGFVNIFNFDKTVGWAPNGGKLWTVVDFDVEADRPVRDTNGFMKKQKVGQTGLLIIKMTASCAVLKNYMAMM